MFGAIRQLERRVSRFDLEKVLQQILSNELLKAQITDLNQKQLYEQGLQADGTPTGEYAPITISHFKPLAAAEGRDGRSDHITGKDTGITYRSMMVESLPDGIIITADDRNNFFDRINKGLGLTGESINELLPEIQERIIEALREAIFHETQRIAA